MSNGRHYSPSPVEEEEEELPDIESTPPPTPIISLVNELANRISKEPERTPICSMHNSLNHRKK